MAIGEPHVGEGRQTLRMALLMILVFAPLQDVPAQDDMIRKLEDDDPKVRQEAEAALGQQWPDRALRKRVAELRDRAGSPDLKERAERILKRLAVFDDFAAALRSRAQGLRAKAEAVPMAEDALKRIADDAGRSPYERAAAAALLGSLAPEARSRELREALKQIHERVQPMHVIRFDMYVRVLGARLEAGTLKFSADDIPLLARIGLLENEGLAILGLAHIDEPNAFNALLAAGSTRLGEGGDAVLYGLERFAAKHARYRDALAAELGQAERRSLGWMRAFAALFAAGDDRVAAPAVALLEDLAAGTLREAPVIGTRLLVNLVSQRPRAEFAAPIRAWILRGGVPLADLAAALKACGGSLEKHELWPLLDIHTQYWEAGAVVSLLLPLLDESDRARLTEMLAADRWKSESFYVRFDLLDKCDAKLLSKEAAAALWKVVDGCDHAFYRARAVTCVSRLGDPADLPRFNRLVGEPGDVGLEALRALLRRSDRPLELTLEILGSQDPARSRTALFLFVTNFLSRGDCPVPKTEENWARIG